MNIIQNSKQRNLIGYSEKHHIVPKCMGGTDDANNIAILTPEEHYVCHQLLVKIYPHNKSLVCAALMMTVGRNNNKLYGWVRRRISAINSENQKGMKNSQYGRKWIHCKLTGVNKRFIGNGPLEKHWEYGKFNQKKTLMIKQKIELAKQKKLNLINLYQSYYEIYKTVGFEKFVKITGYNKTQQNLVQRFSKFVPNFFPQNGKRRGK